MRMMFFSCMPVWLVGVWVGLVALPVDMIFEGS